MDNDLAKINEILVIFIIAVVIQLSCILIMLTYSYNEQKKTNEYLEAYGTTINQIEYNVLTIKEGMKK